VAKKNAKSVKSAAYHHPNLREELLQVAIVHLRTKRAEDISLRDLARKLGVSHMAPYRHFANKDELLAALITDGFKKLSQGFDESFERVRTEAFPQLFSELGRVYIQFVAKNPEQSRLMFGGLLCDKDKYPDTHQAGIETFGRLLRLIELGQASGAMKKEDPHLGSSDDMVCGSWSCHVDARWSV
jgi:AcrR family transcriptional regulator